MLMLTPLQGIALVTLMMVAAGCVAMWFSNPEKPRRSLEKSRSGNLDALPLPAGTIRAKPLLSAWEKAAINTFARQLPPGNRLCPQVRLLDMLTVQDGDHSRQRTTCNRLGSKSVDFAVIDPAGCVVVAIELNDSSHDRPERQNRDKLVKAALAQAGIPLAVFRPRQSLDLGPWLKGR